MMNSNFTSMLNQLKSNPVQFLMQRKMNVPQNIANDPDAIAQHLLNTGQISQQQYNQAVKTYNQMFTQRAR